MSRARRHSRSRSIGALLSYAALALACVAGAAGAATVDYTGHWLTARQVEALAAPALRAPADSTAVTAALGDIVARLQDDGFLDAHADARWNAARDRLAVDVREGPRYTLRRVEVRAISRADSAAIGGALGLRRGEPASPSRVGAGMERALDAAAESGHPFARVTVSDWRVDSSGVDLALSGGLGPAVTIDGLAFQGNRATRAGLLVRAAGDVEGPYRESAARAARDRVEQLGLFRSVALAPLQTAGDGQHARLAMVVEERPYNQFEGVVGAESGHVVGLAHVDFENLAGTGRAAAVRWEAQGQGVSLLSARYAEPLVFGFPLAAEALVEHQVYDTLYTRTRGRLGGIWSLGGGERVEGSVETERVVQSDVDVSGATTQTTRLAVAHARLDDPLVPRRGGTLRLEASQSFSRQHLAVGGSRTVRGSALALDATLNRPLAGPAGLALELSAAGTLTSDRVVPFYDRYALGGAATLRGYDEQAFRVDRFALSRLEWRWFLPARQYAFLFWDHAIAGTRLVQPDGLHLSVLQRDGFGFGLALAASAGRVGLTYGVAPGSGFLQGKVHLQLVSPF